MHKVNLCYGCILCCQGRLHDDEDSTTRSLYETYYPELIAAFTGNLLADTMLFPIETILHRLLLQGTRTIIDNTDSGLGVVPITTQYQGPVDCFFSILSEEGLGGFYKGFGALLLQYGLHMVILRLTRLLFERLSQELSTLSDVTESPQRPLNTEAHLLQQQQHYNHRFDLRSRPGDPRVGPGDVNMGFSSR